MKLNACFSIKDDEMLEKDTEIWEKLSKSIGLVNQHTI